MGFIVVFLFALVNFFPPSPIALGSSSSGPGCFHFTQL